MEVEMTTALSAYTLATLKTDTQYLTGDIEGTRYSPSMLTDAINFAIKTLVARMGYTYKEAQILQTSADTTFPYGVYFPLKGGSGPTAYDYCDYIEIRRIAVGYDDSNSPIPQAIYALNKTTLMQEDQGFLNWRTNTGVPQRWVLLDGDKIVAFPLPVQTNAGTTIYWGVTIGYVQNPALLTSDSDTVDARIPYVVQQYLKFAAASFLLSLDQSDASSLQTAKTYMDTFIAMIGA
jgi:hypothetical protein